VLDFAREKLIVDRIGGDDTNGESLGLVGGVSIRFLKGTSYDH
jgi:hypothetical protein